MPIINIKGTKVLKLTAKQKREFAKTNYVINIRGKFKGFKTLKEVKEYLG